MRTIFTIVKKELKKFFTDPRMLTSLFLPGILIFIIYSVMGEVLVSKMTEEPDTYNIYVENYPVEFNAFISNEEININVIDNKMNIEDIIYKIQNEEIDLYISFEEDFYQKVMNYDSSLGVSAPKLEMYYYSPSMASSTMYQYFYTCFSTFEENLTNKFDINSDINVNYDLASTEDLTIQTITMMLPFLLIVFLFSGAMGICADSIAGEKERGTIATLLITPTRRSNIVLGKVVALGITSLASAVVSSVGLFFSLPKLMGGDFSLKSYGATTIILALVIVILTVLLFTTLLTMVSTYAKSIKEASALSMPLMIVVMLISMSNFMSTTASVNPVTYMIPIYNISQCLVQLFSLSVDPICFIICILSNVVYISLGVFIITKIFNNEEIIFNK